MHYRIGPHVETKLVRCLRGAIYDVIIDRGPDSPTYRHWLGVELGEEDWRMLYVPEGFAHGYQTLADRTERFYHVSSSTPPEPSEASARTTPRSQSNGRNPSRP
jgi:dTDP-4-dehydrorhamnose 3,5-epimerase